MIDDQHTSQALLKSGVVAAAITAHPGPPPGCVTLPLGTLRHRQPRLCRPLVCGRGHGPGPPHGPALRVNDKDRLQSHGAARPGLTAAAIAPLPHALRHTARSLHPQN